MPDTPTQAPPTAGTFCWNELMTKDPAAAKAFYTKLFGWTTEDKDMGELGTYTLFNKDGAQKGGLMQLPPDAAAAGAPSHWMSYIAVDDVDAAAAKATELGGNVMCPPMDIPNAGRFCVFCDPTGAAIAVYKGYGEC